MPTRRTLTAALVALPALHLAGRAQAAGTVPTPAQTEGPFYPLRRPADADHDLLRHGARQYRRGQPAWLDGTLRDLSGRPVTAAQVEIWQCDEDGHYDHPGDGNRQDPAFQGFGQVAVDAQGRWRFRTIRPAPYAGRTPHIHVKVRQGERVLLTTQLYVQGDAGNARDGLWRRLSEAQRAAVTVPFHPVADGLQAHFPIVLDV